MGACSAGLKSYLKTSLSTCIISVLQYPWTSSSSSIMCPGELHLGNLGARLAASSWNPASESRVSNALHHILAWITFPGYQFVFAKMSTGVSTPRDFLFGRLHFVVGETVFPVAFHRRSLQPSCPRRWPGGSIFQQPDQQELGLSTLRTVIALYVTSQAIIDTHWARISG